MKQAYSYDQNHLYNGTINCQLDPLETELQGEEIYILPMNSTWTQPPETKEHEVAQWNGSSWEIVEDYRGTEYWLKTSGWNSPSLIMKELGPLPEGASLSKPERTEEEILEENWKNLRIIRNTLLTDTDFYLMPDYEITQKDKDKIIKYRQQLRDLTSQPGAPWDGGGSETPWPQNPLKDNK